MSKQVHSGGKLTSGPFRSHQELRRVPDAAVGVYRKQTALVVERDGVYQGVPDAHDSGTAHAGEGEVAHHSDNVVHILGDKQDAAVVVDAGLFALIGKGNQKSTCPAGGVHHTDEPLICDLGVKPVIVRIDRRHAPTDVIRGEELSCCGTAEVERHVHLTEKVLIRLSLNTQLDLAVHLGKDVDLISLVLPNGIQIPLFTLFIVNRVQQIGDRTGRDGDEILEDLPPVFAAVKGGEQPDDLFLVRIPDKPCVLGHQTSPPMTGKM